MSNRLGAPGLKLTIRFNKKRKTFESIEAVSKAFKIPYNTLYQRLFIMKWPAAKAATTAVRKRKRKVKSKKKRV